MNPAAASVTGRVDVARLQFLALVVSGAIAGVAGAIEVAGVTYSVYDGIASGVGYTAIAVALLGNLNPIGILGAAVLFGALGAGADAMQRDAGVPAAIVISAGFKEAGAEGTRLEQELRAISRERGIRVVGQGLTTDAGFTFTFENWNLFDDQQDWCDATTGTLKTMWEGAYPAKGATGQPYDPMRKQGAIILGIGFLMVGWTDRKRGLHDMIAGTLVIKVN